MSYPQKMLKHLAEAEARDADVKRFDAWADARIEDRDKTELDSYGKAREGVKLERMRKLLEGEILYGSRASSRDYHVRMATMYAEVIQALEALRASSRS